MQNHEIENVQKNVKILRLTPPMLISALKSGPVVPPGIEKVPNQAARISQSVDFGHLSDILTLFEVPHFLTLFLLIFIFTLFSFCAFLCFCIFHVLLILMKLTFCHFDPFFVIRPYCNVM